MRYNIFFILCFFSFAAFSQLQCGQDIDLNTWIQEGNSTDGKWTVSASGNSVEQSINGEPTFFVSPDTFINVIMEGKIKVNTANDDDLVGFVFGFKNPSGVVTPNAMNVQTYVFDWKQREQTDGGGTSKEGFALYKVDGIVDYSDYANSTGPVFWARENTDVSQLLASNFGVNGWNDFQEYTFRLLYTAWNITIWIDGEEVVNVDGCYEPGRFGFYNSSQNFVIYSDFSYQYVADFDVINPDICVNDTGRFAIGFNDCPYSGFYPHGTQFKWDFGDGEIGYGRAQKHKYSVNGSYEVMLSVIDPLGCVATSSHHINVDWMQMGPIDSVGVCEGKEVVVDVSTDGGVKYLWNDGTTLPEIVVDEAGVYIVQIEDSTGCVGFDTTIVDIYPNPIIDIGEDTSLCVGDTLGLKVNLSGLNYQWSNGGTTAETVVNDPGVYWVMGETQFGCLGSDSVFLDVAQPSVFLPIDTQLCKPTNPLVVAPISSEGHHFLWNTGDTSQFVAVDSSAVLILTVFDNGGCFAQDTMIVYMEDFPVVSLPNDTSMCEDGSIFLTPSASAIYQEWSGPEFKIVGDQIEIFKSGLYTLEVSSPLGCKSMDSVRIQFNPNPVLDLGPDTVMCFDVLDRWVIDAEDGWDQYIWSNGAKLPSITVSSSGTYALTIKTIEGCEATDEISVENYCPHSIYIPNAFTPNGDGYNDYFPTPNYNLNSYSLMIFNRWGELLFEGDSPYSQWDGRYNNIDCQIDVYVWRIEYSFVNEKDEVETKSRVGRVSLIR